VVRVPAAGLLLLGLAFCGSTLKTAPLGPHAEYAQQHEVDYPPPPAKVELVPPAPGEQCVWVDGNWEWRGRQWDWQSGKWVVPPPGCHYAAARLSWIDSARGGTLYFTPPNWYPDEKVEQSKAKTACKPVPCSASGASEGQGAVDGG